MRSGCSVTGDWLPDWKEGEGERGFSKGTLNYMKKNAECDKPFTLNQHVRERVNQWKNPAINSV